MLAEAYRKAAEDREKSIVKLQPDVDPDVARLAIEGAWGAAFHWIAFGCQTKHGRHQESHARLVSFLNNLGEGSTAAWWQSIDSLRQGGMYGNKTDSLAVQEALTLLREIHRWASS